MTLIRGGPAGPHTEDATGYKNLVEDDRAALWNSLGGKQGIIWGHTHSLVAGQLAHQFTAGAAAVEERDGSGNAGVLARGYHLFNDVTFTVVHAAPDALTRNDAVVFAYVDIEDGAIGAGVSQSGPQVVIVKGVSGTSTPRTDAQITTALGRGGWFRFADVLIDALDTEVDPLNVTFSAARFARSRTPGLSEIVVITASGTFKKADYPGLRLVRVRLVAGGGAGGGAEASAAGDSSGGAGGGAGAYGESLLLESALAVSETVTIGAGGTGVSGASGNAGSTTSFGAHVTAGGGSGGGATASSVNGDVNASVPGGTAGTGQITSKGRSGAPFKRITGIQGWSGEGGHSPLGTGGRELVDVSAAGEAGEKGGGGSGAISRNGGAAFAGGAGGAGIIIVEVYK